MVEGNGTLPVWATEIKGMYESGVAHSFGLHFNICDYVTGSLGLRPWLDRFFAKREIIVHYNRAEGLTFATESMRSRFMEVLGLSEAQDEALLALQQVQGGGGPRNDLPREPGPALRLLDQLLRQRDVPSVAIVEHAETLAPATDKAMMSPEDRTNLVLLSRLGTDRQVVDSGNMVILVTANLSEVHPDLRAASAKCEWLELPLPTYEERLAFVEWLLARGEGLTLEMSVAQLAAMTAGLSKVHIEDIKLRAEKAGGLITAALVRERKESIIKQEYADVLELWEPTYGFELIGGLEHVKTFFREWVIEPVQQGWRDMVPLGVLLLGPAGTGKTAVAKAVAKESGLNCCLLKADRILGGIVGTSEKNLAKALRCIESLAPCIVFVDEIDQRFQRSQGGGDGGSSVNANIFSSLLEFMSDERHRGRIVFLGASNRPDLLDAALRRPGRFDYKIPFLVPDQMERAEILAAMLRKYGVELGEDDRLDAIAEATDGWTGAELEAVVVKARGLMRLRKVRLGVALTAAASSLSPSTSDIEYQTALAVRECNDTSLLPARYQAMLADRKSLDQRVKALRPEEPERRGRREL